MPTLRIVGGSGQWPVVSTFVPLVSLHMEPMPLHLAPKGMVIAEIIDICLPCFSVVLCYC